MMERKEEATRGDERRQNDDRHHKIERVGMLVLSSASVGPSVWSRDSVCVRQRHSKLATPGDHHSLGCFSCLSSFLRSQAKATSQELVGTSFPSDQHAARSCVKQWSTTNKHLRTYPT